MPARLTLVAVIASAAGCTLDAGGWFGTLEPSLAATYAQAPDRDAGGGWQKLSSDYQVKLTRASWTLGEIQVLGGAEGNSVGFDPAKPPPGYSLCHNGHCHADDGRLVSYEDIAAELVKGSGGGLKLVISFPVEGGFDLLAPGTDRALACKPSCSLDRTHLRRVVAPVNAVTVEGSVRDGRSSPRFAGEQAFRWHSVTGVSDAGAPGLALTAELDVPIDRSHDPHVKLRLMAALTAALFDGIDFAPLAAMATEGAIDLGAPSGAGAQERLSKNLGEIKLGAAVTRSD